LSLKLLFFGPLASAASVRYFHFLKEINLPARNAVTAPGEEANLLPWCFVLAPNALMGFENQLR
jgi:hypothetical protein